MRTISPEQMNNPLTFNDLLTGNITIYLDMDYETIFKLRKKYLGIACDPSTASFALSRRRDRKI